MKSCTVSFPLSAVATMVSLFGVAAYFTCTKDTLFNPTGAPGVTITAYACDTTGLDTAITLFDSKLSILSAPAGRTITFLGLINGDSSQLSKITWRWDFGDGGTSKARIVEHRYMAAGTYRAVFTITDNVGFSLRDTVNFSATPVSPHAAVAGRAFFQGKSKHDGIEVVIRSEGGIEYKMTSNEKGFLQKMSNVPYGTYAVYYRDKKTDWFSSDSVMDVKIIDGILNELGSVTLKDNYQPHIQTPAPAGTVDNRMPMIEGILSDTASGIAKETFLLVFNNDTIPDSLVACSESGFSWRPSYRLPDGRHTVFASIKDSAGNKASTAWTFIVDAMKLIVMQDTLVRINDTVRLYGRVSNVYCAIEEYRWDFDGDGTWDNIIKSRDTLIVQPFVYTSAATYKARLYARDDSGMVKLDTVTITVGNQPPIISAIRADTTISIKDSILLFGVATDADGTIKEYTWDFDGNGTFDYASATEIQAGYRYNTAGIYKAVLRVTDDDGKASKDTAIVTVLQDVPIANAGMDTVVSINDTVRLHGSATQQFGTIAEWAWDFGNTGTFKVTSKGDTVVTAPVSENLN